LKTTSLIISAAAIALLAGSFAVKLLAQSPDPRQKATAGAAPPPHHEEPAPTNLKVLPKTMTGEQVHDLMHQWEAELGTECSTCHAADPTKIGRNGKPRLNFADDSKKEKLAARLMVKMTEEINTEYVNMIENSGKPVTFGTCHRGHLKPEEFVPPPRHERGGPPAVSGEEPAAQH